MRIMGFDERQIQKYVMYQWEIKDSDHSASFIHFYRAALGNPGRTMKFGLKLVGRGIRTWDWVTFHNGIGMIYLGMITTINSVVFNLFGYDIEEKHLNKRIEEERKNENTKGEGTDTEVCGVDNAEESKCNNEAGT